MFFRLSNSKTPVVVAISLLFVFIAGCAMFKGSNSLDTQSEGARFKPVVSYNSNPVPLPVEIAKDISTIAAGGKVDIQNNWAPTGAPQGQGYYPYPYPYPPPPGERNPAEAAAEGTAPRQPWTGGKTVKHTVKSGDTLMKIAFENYGNVYRWKEIYNANKEQILNFNKLVAGTILVINNVEYIVIEKNGVPYLIRRGDSLTKISKHLYGTMGYWRDLWQNNKQLIHNPNKIYAGFTLYYKDEWKKNRLAKDFPLPPANRRTPASKKAK